MGAFFAVLGAVLLFVLKAVGILLLAVLILAAVLLLCPFCADVCWEHGILTVKAGALGIVFPVFQYPKKPAKRLLLTLKKQKSLPSRARGQRSHWRSSARCSRVRAP